MPYWLTSMKSLWSKWDLMEKTYTDSSCFFLSSRCLRTDDLSLATSSNNSVSLWSSCCNLSSRLPCRSTLPIWQKETSLMICFKDILVIAWIHLYFSYIDNICSNHVPAAPKSLYTRGLPGDAELLFLTFNKYAIRVIFHFSVLWYNIYSNIINHHYV